MVAADYPSAVRAGTMAAARLHQQLDLRQQIEVAGGNVDVFAAIHAGISVACQAGVAYMRHAARPKSATCGILTTLITGM